jgi:hypothetical protein
MTCEHVGVLVFGGLCLLLLGWLIRWLWQHNERMDLEEDYEAVRRWVLSDSTDDDRRAWLAFSPHETADQRREADDHRAK